LIVSRAPVVSPTGDSLEAALVIRRAEVVTVGEPNWSYRLVSERLRRDVDVAGTYLAIAARSKRASCLAAQRAAAEYWHWVSGPALTELNSDGLLEEFVGKWRLRAAAADIRAPGTWTEFRPTLVLVLSQLAVVEWLGQNVTSAAAFGGVLMVLLVSLRWRRSNLVVGPQAARRLPWTSPKSVEAWTIGSSHARFAKEVRP
jgi:hypothetical protein